MTKISIKFIIAVLSIVFASLTIGLWIVSINKSNKMIEELQTLNNRVWSLENDLSQIRYDNNNLKNEIKGQLIEQGKNYYDVNYKIISLENNQSALIEVYFSLKETSLSGEAEIIFGSNNQFEQTPATKLADGKYKAQIELDINKTYQISYSVVLYGLKIEKLMDINVLNDLEKRINADAKFSIHYVYENKKERIEDVTIHFWLMNNYSGEEKLKIKSAVLEIYKNDSVYKTVNIMDYNPSYYSGVEQFGGEFTFDGWTIEDANQSKSFRIKIVDNLGLEYTF